MAAIVFLCGVSGSGKTRVLEDVNSKSFAVIELDPIIKRLFSDFQLDQMGETDPYAYSVWTGFLRPRLGDQEVISAFRRRIADQLASGSGVIAGNHFVLPEFDSIVAAAVGADCNCIHRLLLDVAPKTVYDQRMRRGTKWDKMVTLDQVEREVRRARQTLTRGYLHVSPSQLMEVLVGTFPACQ